MISSGTLQLLFQAKADTADASKKFEELKNSVTKDVDAIKDAGNGGAEGLAKLSTAGFDVATAGAALGGAIAGAATVVAGFAVVVAGATAALFNFTAGAAQYGEEIYRASKQTGLTAETISTLKFFAEKTGVTFDQLTDLIGEFTNLIGDAANGSKEAAAKLARLGIDPQKAIKDFDGALAQVIKKIDSLQNPVERVTAAVDGFGESGRYAVGMVQAMSGDLAAATAQVEKYGGIVDTQGAKMSHEFTVALSEIQTQVKGLAFMFAREFMPYFTSALKGISQLLMDNQGNFREWGKQIGITLIQLKNNATLNFKILTGVYNAFADFLSTSWIGTIIEVFKTIAYYTTPSAWLAGNVFNAFADNWKQSREKAEKEFDRFQDNIANKKIGDALNPTLGKETNNYFSGDAEAARKKAEELRREREAIAQKNRNADINRAKLDQQIAEQNYKEEIANLKQALEEKQITVEQYSRGLETAFAGYKARLEQIFVERGNLENFKKTKKERDLLFRQLDNEQATIVGNGQNEIEKLIKDAQEKQTDTVKKETTKRLKIAEDEVRGRIAIDKASAESRVKQFEFELSKENLTFAERRKLTENLGLFKLEQINREISALSEIEITEDNRRKIAQDINALTEKRNQQGLENAKALRELAEKELEFRKALEKEQGETEAKRSKVSLDNQRKEFESAINSGKNKLINLKALLAFEENLLTLERDRELEKQKLEQETYLKSIEGATKEAEMKASIDELYKQKALLAEEEFQQKLKEIRDSLNPQIKAEEQDTSLFGGLIKQMKEFFNIGKELPTLASVFTSFAGILTNAFQSVANALGQVLQQWVLTGKTGPGVMRKILASALATIAAEAAVRAIFELAAGFASLFFNPGEAAAHFTAAALYGSIAGVAALAGRAVAGNAFTQQQQGAFGSNQTQSNRSGEGGTYYSSRESAVLDLGANQAQNVPTIVIKDKSGLFGEFFRIEVEKGGLVRETIREVAS